MFNVLVTNPEGKNIFFKSFDKKSDAKKLVKELRKKGKKAQFVTAKATAQVDESEIEFITEDEEEEDAAYCYH
jgi:hypothetical protein